VPEILVLRADQIDFVRASHLVREHRSSLCKFSESRRYSLASG
jgi:hypothetical protein